MRKPKPPAREPYPASDPVPDTAPAPVPLPAPDSTAGSGEHVEPVVPAPRVARVVRLRQWVRRHRRDAAAHLLRGTCYGLGTGAVGLAFWWIQQQL